MFMYKFDAKKEKDELVEWIKDYFKDIPNTNIILGISGGKDSTVAAVLYCRALGKDKVKALFLPEGDQQDIDVAKERNRNRLPSYKFVPEEVIDKMYARFVTQKVPTGIKVIKPEEFDTILYKSTDLNNYKKVHVIGDIHSSYTVLKDYILSFYTDDERKEIEETGLSAPWDLNQWIKDDEYFIFCGDYLDRGTETIEILQFLISICNLPNVVLLTGNHERNLNNFIKGIDDYPKYFRETTYKELQRALTTKQIKMTDLKNLFSKLVQTSYFTYGDKKVVVTHGGISDFKENLIYIAADQMINGVGRYEDYMSVAEAFERNTDKNTYQINGHRNVTGCPIQATERCFNLEGKVEFGGYLRVVTLDKNGFETHEIKNNVFKLPEEKVVEAALPKEILTNDVIVTNLRKNPFIKEKVMGNISSFNFNRKAFRKGIWDEQTIRSRGLFIDTRNNTVVATGYRKFFDINERDETKLVNLQHNLKFPVTAYVKENGFLCLISYNKDTDDLMFATKSVVDYAAEPNDLVLLCKKLYEEIATDVQRQNLLDYLRTHNQTVVCECVHKNDPHIIEYDKNAIYLLDIIENDFEGAKMDYHNLRSFASGVGLICKEKAFVLNNWEDLYNQYLEVTVQDYEYKGKYIEGFVLEDNEGFMIKLKLFYYKFWKMLRSLSHEVLKRGYTEKPEMLWNAESNLYYGWLRDHRDEFISYDEDNKVVVNETSIINLRNKFKESLLGGK